MSAGGAVDTRTRILDVARKCFAEYGYEATSNKMIVAELGITTAAIYYHFESKLELYREVHASARSRAHELFADAVASANTSAVGRVRALFEAAHELNNSDPTLALFLAGSRVDQRRIPGLTDAVDSTRSTFFTSIVDEAIEQGEIAAVHRDQLIACLHTFTVGLSFDASDDPAEHRDALEGLLALLGAFTQSAAART